MRYMLDTNICIYLMNRKNQKLRKELEKHYDEGICISSITYSELMWGIENSQYQQTNRIRLLMLLSRIRIMDFSSRAGEEYGKLRFDLKRKGTPIGDFDTLIAGHAKALKCTLVTNNLKEFKRVKGLEVEDWSK